MSRPAVETSEPAIPAAQAPAWRVFGRRLLPAGVAVFFIVLGGAMLASNLGLLAPEVQRALNVAWPAGLVLAGLGLILAGDHFWAGELAGFAVEKGEVEQADLVAAAGTADLHIEAATGTGELASGELPFPKKPKVDVRDHRTTLRLEPPWGLPELGGSRWSVALACGLPWRLNLRSSTGNLDLNLADLSLAELRLSSIFGDVDLSLPAAGGADLDLGLLFGDLTLRVPEGLGVKVKLQLGALADVAHDERRFIRLPSNEIGTPLYAVASKRCALTVRLGTGSLRLL
jgi:hypothetical protein